MKHCPTRCLAVCTALLFGVPVSASLNHQAVPDRVPSTGSAVVLDLGLPADAQDMLLRRGDDGGPRAAGAALAPPRNRAPAAAAGTDGETSPERQTDTFPRVADDPVDDPEDLDAATLNAGPIIARVGPQKLAYSSLIHADLDRVGAVAHLDMGPSVQVRGFGASAESVAGFDALLGTGRADYQINGVIIERGLGIPGVEHGRLTAGWISGSASNAHKRLRSGRAWSVASDAAWLSSRLRLRLEYAGSELDPMRLAAGTGRAAGSGQAYRARFELHGPAAAHNAWRIGSEYSSVSAQFGSLANPTLVADRERVKAFAVADVGTLNLDLQWDQDRSNPHNDPLRAATDQHRTRFAATWTADESAAFDLFGRPTCKLLAGVSQSRDRRAAEDADAARTMTLSLQTEFAHPQWLWGARARGSQAPGKIDASVAAGLESFAFDLYGKTLAEAFPPVNPVLSWERKRDLETGTSAQRFGAGLSSSPFDLRHDLRANFDLGYQHRVRSDGSMDDHAARLSAKLRWLLHRPSSRYQGLALEFAGRYTTGGDAGAGFGDDFQVMLSLSSVALADL